MGHHDFADLILYVKPGERNSLKAEELASGLGAVHVQSIDDLPRPLPPWLNGVPTLVRKEDRRAFRGTDCLGILREASRLSWSGFSSDKSFIGGFASGSAMSHGAAAPFHAAFQEDEGAAVTAGRPGGGPGQLPPPRRGQEERTARVGEDEVQAYMQARG